jgi:hypothetical protein
MGCVYRAIAGVSEMATEETGPPIPNESMPRQRHPGAELLPAPRSEGRERVLPSAQ